VTDLEPVRAVQLHLLRHAHAGDPETWDGPDASRPLSSRGERQADRLGRFLAGIGFKTDAIITSPKVRAAQTAELVAKRLGVPVGTDDRLGGELGLGTLEAILRDAGDPSAPILVGHDPDFSDLVVKLCGASGVPMRKGSFARIDADRPFEPGQATLRWLVPPDLLKPDR
jgi:phosphohistidine phosphatase